jgi:uncharacterized protein DUF6516
MNTVEEYFDHIRQLVQDLPDAQPERYEEHLLSATRGNLRIRLRFADNTLLEISEAFILVSGELRRLSYRYHYQDALATLVFRYDNAPHHPEILTHPDHKHSGEQILASFPPSIEQLLEEVQALRKTAW